MTPDEQLIVEAAKRGLIPDFKVPLDKAMDKTSGASAKVRRGAGGAVTPEDKLATIRMTYPDAEPYGDDNFVFTNPKTGRPTLYNPKGLDAGDFSSIAPEVAEMAGGAVGGAVAAAPALAGAVPTGGASLLAIPAAVGLGAAAGREMENIAQTASGNRVDTRGPVARVTDAGVTAGTNAVAGRVGELIGQGVRAVAAPVMRAGQQVRQAMTDFANVGVQPTAGAVTGNRSIQTIEQGLANTPGGAGPMQEAARNALDQLETASARLANQYGTPGSKQAVGERLRGGARDAAARFADRRETLDLAIEGVVGRDVRVPVQNVAALRQQLQAQLADAPASRAGELGESIGILQRLEADAANGGVPFGALRSVRTALGRQLDRPDVAGYSPASEASLRRAYGALSEDIGAAARANGAERELALHDRYVRFNRNVNLPTLQKLADQGTDEQAYNFALQGAKDGNSRLATLRRNLTGEEWDVVSSSVLSRLGRANPGAQGASELGQEGTDFSVNTFLTNWNKLSTEAKNTLFGGNRYAAMRDDLNSLVRVTGMLKEAEKMGNPSGTARSVAVQGLLAPLGGVGGAIYGGDVESAGYGAAGTMAAGVVAPRYAARLITNPRFISWLTDSANQTPTANSMAGQISRLVAIAKVEPGIREEVSQYLSALSGGSAPMSTSQGADKAGKPQQIPASQTPPARISPMPATRP